MKKKFYVVFNNYSPDCAPINRLLSYLKSWSQMDVEIVLVFMLPDPTYSRLTIKYDNVRVVYMWDNCKSRLYLLHHFLLFWYIHLFKTMLRTGDNVYLYSQFFLAKKLLQRKDISVYMEITEHPKASNPGHWPYKISHKSVISVFKELKGVFVISTSLKNYLCNNGVDASKIRIVNMTVDTSRFDGVIKDITSKPYVAYCGTVSNNKDGVDKLIYAFSSIKHKFPELYLYIIGYVSPNDENVLLVKKLGIEDRVVFTGLVSYSEMPHFLINAKILALSRPNNLQAQYGFPTKLGEYLLSSNPVVVTNVGDIPLFVKDGVNGMVAKPDDTNEFAKKIEWLLDHPEEAKRIGENGRLLAIEQFNCLNEAPKIVNFIFCK